MRKGYLAIVFYIIHICSSIAGANECSHFCDADGCQPANSKKTIDYCRKKDIPDNVNLTFHYQNDTDFFGELQINFAPPKGVCQYQVMLFANESISEEKCMNYSYKNYQDTEIHTTNTICFISNNTEYQPSVTIPFQYIFTACYGVQIFFGNYTFKRWNKFLKTNYNHTEVIEPQIKCDYDILSDSTKKYKGHHFKVDFSVSIATMVSLQLGSVYYTSDNRKGCNFHSKHLSNSYQSFNIYKEYIQNKRNNSNTSLITNGMYQRRTTFMVKALQNVDYCVVLYLYDIRCEKLTLWNPLKSLYNPCEWFRECKHAPLHYSVEIDTKISSYLFPCIIIVILSMFIILGVCVMCTYDIQKHKFYIKITKRNEKTNQQKYNKMNVHALKDKEKPLHKNISGTSTDIVLLYPKSSKSFMALMADFREILSTACQCLVHDWYDSMQWDYVAKIGGADWFAEILNNGSRVIWIDTPTTRSLIKLRFKQNTFVKDSEQYNYIKIGDFRDRVFPTIFDLAKRNVDASVIQQDKHFIVRINEFEKFENEDDPFVDLASHKRYLIPQDLRLLCSELSIVKFGGTMSLMSREEDLIKQHLCRVEIDSRE